MKKQSVALAILLLLSGCFQIDNAITLKSDMSGTADFHLGIDMEPMVVIMAQVGRSMEGKTGPVPPEEIAKAKADFKKSAKKSVGKAEGEKPKKEDVEKGLPPGVKLLSFDAKEQDFGVDTYFKFGFDKLSHLVGVKLPSSKSEDPTKKSVIDTPFEGLEVVERGDTITIRTKPQNPSEKVQEEQKESGGPPADPEMEKMMKDAFKKMRVTYRITAPFKVVSSNATRVEGQTLIWEYNMEKFEEMSKKKNMDDLAVHVTYKR
ncbi:MAG TPA: hypothetical protein VG323_03705 [Thermoanaerobaculia bacterium]|nr:hypothetical protein [Thermoanaerobaculia bacterium]